MLSLEEEQALAWRWRDHQDLAAAHRLVTCHLRLVAKIARSYRGYGFPAGDLIGEGSVGLMQAVERFDPNQGFRLATYAMWWIRAAMQNYILHNWSLVRLGTTAAQKRLFFNLRRIKGQMRAIEDGDLEPEQVGKIAQMLRVPEHEVISMNRRLAGPDHSLNGPARLDGESDWQETLPDESESHEQTLGDREELTERKALLAHALTSLSERERHILTERRLRDNSITLEELSRQYGVSSERVRQIEVCAVRKLQKAVKASKAGLPMPSAMLGHPGLGQTGVSLAHPF